MDDDEEINYADMEPEYDMEFARYGPNTLNLPISPPRTPPMGVRSSYLRESSPFSEASSMTSVHSTESVSKFLQTAVIFFLAPNNYELT